MKDTMSLATSNFTIEQLESRFEMQCMNDSGGLYYDQQFISSDDGGCGGGGGGAYDYYGSSWTTGTSGEGYGGVYQGDGSGNAQLDDGTYTDQSSGAFPAYKASSNVSVRSFCRICRCRF
jgi:hypothetical protein